MDAEDLKCPKGVKITFSRERWLSIDDAPKRYFLIKLKAKQARKSMEMLEEDDGEVTTDPEEILNRIRTFYETRYRADIVHDHDTPESLEIREEVIGLVSKRLSPAEGQKVLSMPQREKIESVVFSMKAHKSSGHDGVTIDIVKACWDTVGDSCIRLVQVIWAKRRMLKADCQSMIKLIPKTGVETIEGELFTGRAEPLTVVWSELDKEGSHKSPLPLKL
ncbi:hypothetical protein R1sor_000896 [Riccia sorocarpa]|uniref:DNA helicase n=1 Tax=Riccia sorocarpa TaxID=122646 RepID=A0ABD3GX01_9MARC